MSAQTTFQVFSPLLRAAGFRKTYDSRSGGCRVVEYSRRVGDNRVIDVQLWSDGGHRASHWIGGRMTTVATEFDSPEGLAVAIERESARTDNAAQQEPGQ